jgi:hypothetical protein
MALGPTLLLPPLQEIQRNIKRLDEKYDREKLYLNVLDKDEEKELVQQGSAPRNVIYGFLSTLAEQLFKFNMLKNTIDDEKRLKKRISKTLLTMIIILVLSLLFILLTFILIPRFTGKSLLDAFNAKASSKKVDVFTKVETVYFMFFLVMISVYFIFVSGVTYQKYTIIYDKYYDNDSLFSTESNVNYITTMMQSESTNITQNLRDRQIRLKGTNPLLGYFIHKNRNVDVIYDFIPHPLSNDEISPGFLHLKKTFRFSDKRSKPFTLGSNSLLKKENLPGILKDQSDDNLYLMDPFIKNGSNVTIGDPKILNQKLDRFDIYGQYKKINDAIIYFETIMSRNMIQFSDLGDRFIEKITSKIKETVNFQKVLCTKEIKPSIEFASTLGDSQKQENISEEEFIIYFMDSNIPFVSYNKTSRTAYYFTKDDLKSCIFQYAPMTSQNEYLNCFKKTDLVTINIAISKRPPDSVLNSHFVNHEVTNNQFPGILCFEADISLSDGIITERKSDDVLKPKRSSLTLIPDIHTLFSGILITNQSLSSEMFIYQLPLDVFLYQSQTNNLQNTFLVLKSYFHARILTEIGKIDKQYQIDLTDDVSYNVKNYLQSVFSNNYNLFDNAVDDFFQELYKKIKEKERDNQNESISEDKTNTNKFVNYDMFLLYVKNMKQDEFINKFVYNLDVLRNTSSGLKKLNDKFNYGQDIIRKDLLIYEYTFYMFAIFGCFELVRYIINQVMYYKCDEVGLITKEDEYKNEFSIKGDDSVNERLVKNDALQKQLKKTSNKRSSLLSTLILRMSISVVIYLFCVAFLFSWKERVRTLHNYNNYILENNGNRIVIDSDLNFHYIVSLLRNNNEFVTVSNFVDSGDPDELYPSLKQNSQIEKDKVVQTSESLNLFSVHKRLIDTIENYNKCNLLIDGKQQRLPFPLLETSVYIISLILVVILMLYVYISLQPIKKYSDLNKWKKIKKLLDKGIAIDSASYGFLCNEPKLKKKQIYTTLTFVVAAIVLLFGGMVSVAIFKNSSSFTTSIYNSPLFQDSKCYNAG